MANRVYIQFTKFVNIDNHGKIQGVNLGYRIFDDYDKAYKNHFTSLVELNDEVNESNLIDYIKQNHPNFIESVESKGGVDFNGMWVELK